MKASLNYLLNRKANFNVDKIVERVNMRFEKPFTLKE